MILEELWVKARARLHMGHLDLNGSLGRLYGGMGLAIDQPQLELTARKNKDLMIICSNGEDKRVMGIAGQYLEYYHLPGVIINLMQSLPSHSGLGSGTQLALAIGFVISRVYGLEPSLAELAAITDRESSRSGIGVAAFEKGGFLVDGGRAINDTSDKFSVPPLLFRMPFPEEWTVILALPNQEEKIFGVNEENSFKSLPPMEEIVSSNICRILLMKLLPSLMEKDLEGFGQAVSAVQKYLGNYYAPVQGGRYACTKGAELAAYLLSHGAQGVGQSSWGPTVYGFTTQDKQAGLLESTRLFLGDGGQVWAAKGSNHGASYGWR